MATEPPYPAPAAVGPWGRAVPPPPGEREAGRLTPHVVITGSLNTPQQSWQHSFTEGCSANTSGSCDQAGWARAGVWRAGPGPWRERLRWERGRATEGPTQGGPLQHAHASSTGWRPRGPTQPPSLPEGGPWAAPGVGAGRTCPGNPVWPQGPRRGPAVTRPHRLLTVPTARRGSSGRPGQHTHRLLLLLGQ